jgi:hypothetical protein
MKWLFFSLSLLSLFFTNNVLFWIPGQYDWFNFAAAGVGVTLATLFAWLSARRFVSSSFDGQPKWGDLLETPPAVICIFVLLLFSAVGLLKIAAYASR